jgi:hypothetical protein
MKSTLENLQTWFFKDGKLRPEKHKLGYSGWVRRLYTASDDLEICDQILNSRKAVALWGASQVGKSTLLSSFIDPPSKEEKTDSALQWSSNEKIYYDNSFVSDFETLCWNPYNFNSDASACITRFQSSKDVKYDDCPVEIKLASYEQITHSIALGYLSECKLEELRGETIFLDDEKLTALIGDFVESDLNPSKENFETLFSIFKVLLNLCKSGQNRYSNLKEQSVKRLLDAFPRISDENLLNSIACNLFWDNSPPLNKLWQEMIALNKWFQNSIGPDGKIYCSYAVATLINDMASFQSAVGGTSLSGESITPIPSIQEKIRNICFIRRGDDLVLNLKDGHPFSSSPVSFAVMQGIVWEMIVSLNESSLGKNSSSYFKDLLDEADILDFPGVSREGTLNEDQRLSTGSLEKDDTNYLLYSKVLKRGKTACIGTTAARIMRIDSFCILNKAKDQIPSSDQLYKGVQNWWEYCSGECFETSTKKHLPLNFIITFFSDLANDLIANPNNEKFSQSLDKLKALKNLVNPKLVSFFATNYSKFGTFRNISDSSRPATEKEISSAKSQILKNQVIKSTFGKNIKSLENVFSEPTGGVEFLFQSLLKQVSASTLPQLEKRRNEVKGSISLLFSEALPDEAAMAQKAKEIINSAISYLQDSKSSRERLLSTSSSVIELTNIDPESVPPIPSRLKSKPATLKEAYVSTCLSSWKSEKREALLPRQFGFGEADDFSQFISLICDSINIQHLADWLSDEFPSLTDRESRYYTRRYLCIAINEKLSGKSLTADNQYSPIENCLARLKEYENSEDSEVSPHYDSIIYPFIKKLESVSEMELNERGELPGDVDLIQISQNFGKN